MLQSELFEGNEEEESRKRICSLGCPTNTFCLVANDSDMTAVERRNKIEGGDETCMTGMNIRIVCPVQREREEEAMAL